VGLAIRLDESLGEVLDTPVDAA